MPLRATGPEKALKRLAARSSSFGCDLVHAQFDAAKLAEIDALWLDAALAPARGPGDT